MSLVIVIGTTLVKLKLPACVEDPVRLAPSVEIAIEPSEMLTMEAAEIVVEELVECTAGKLVELLTTRVILRAPDAKCEADAFATIVDVITTDFVEVTVVYIVPVTLLVVPFGKNGVEVWLNEPSVTFPVMGNIVAELVVTTAGINEVTVALPRMYDMASEPLTFAVGTGT